MAKGPGTFSPRGSGKRKAAMAKAVKRGAKQHRSKAIRSSRHKGRRSR